MENQNLEHITGHRLQELADLAGVSREYVRLLLAGERERNSDTAKKILEAAEVLNEAIRAGLDGAEKVLILKEEHE